MYKGRGQQPLTWADVAHLLGATIACPDPPAGFHFPPTSVLVISSHPDLAGFYDLAPSDSGPPVLRHRGKQAQFLRGLVGSEMRAFSRERNSDPIQPLKGPLPAPPFSCYVAGSDVQWGKWDAPGLRWTDVGLVWETYIFPEHVQRLATRNARAPRGQPPLTQGTNNLQSAEKPYQILQ